MRDVYVIALVMQVELHKTRNVPIILNHKDMLRLYALPMLWFVALDRQNTRRLSQKHHGCIEEYSERESRV